MAELLQGPDQLFEDCFGRMREVQVTEDKNRMPSISLDGCDEFGGRPRRQSQVVRQEPGRTAKAGTRGPATAWTRRFVVSAEEAPYSTSQASRWDFPTPAGPVRTQR
ncbi:hypothetical protein DBP12_30150 [Streptomyces sp. CS014]|nr:hypothetical protein DBP12_30150 [Streptomyces sp. CS014]